MLYNIEMLAPPGLHTKVEVGISKKWKLPGGGILPSGAFRKYGDIYTECQWHYRLKTLNYPIISSMILGEHNITIKHTPQKMHMVSLKNEEYIPVFF